jgi:HAD superfamily hydrolase (TIGR01509 family)
MRNDMPKIKCVLFDAAGVLYDRAEPTDAFAKRRLAELGYAIDLSEGDLARKEEMRILATEGRLHHEAYWNELLQLYRVTDAEQRAALNKEIQDHTFDLFPYPGGREMMAGLRARGFVLGIVTDTMHPVEWKMQWLKKAGVDEFVDVMACSSSLGAHKPQPEMYLYAVRQAHLAPSESAFVGHDARELAGAQRAGLATIAVNYAPGAIADYYANSLLDLLNVPILHQSS